MRTDATLYIVLVKLLLVLVVFVSVGCRASKCLTDMTPTDYTKNNYYFRYCKKGGVMARQKGHQTKPCRDGGRLKVMNFDAYLPRKPTEESCKLNIIRYNRKAVLDCLSRSQRDDVVKPFITALSGKRLNEVNDVDEIASEPHTYKQVVLDVGCEADSSLKMDMCKPKTAIFNEKNNVSLSFNFASYMENDNHTSCFCYFKTFNTSRKISLRAFDIRLHDLTRLSLDSVQLSPSIMYWWQSGVLSPSLSVLELSGLQPNTVPTSVWVDVFGTNMNITCDIKPLFIEGLATNTPQKHGSSSTGGLSSVYVAIIVISGIVLIIIALLVVKCAQSRMSNASHSGAYKVDDPYASENFISSTYERGDEPPSPRESIVVYSKPDPRTSLNSRGGRKCRKGGESDESRLYEFDSDSDQDGEGSGTIGNGLVTSSEHRVSHEALVHDLPKQSPADDSDTANIYNHFSDHPDVVPTSTTNNIYNTAGTGIYSSLKPNRQQSMPDNTYSTA